MNSKVENKKVIYYAFTDEKERIIDYLHEIANWTPAMVLGGHQVENISKEKYPDVVVQNAMSLRQAQFDYSKLGKPVPIGEDLVTCFEPFMTNFFSVFEDSTKHNYSYAERKRYFYDILKYWNTVFHHIKPDIFICFTWPHSHACYSLYILAKYYFKIEVLFIDAMLHLNKNDHVVCNSVEEQYGPFFDLYSGSTPLKVGTDGAEYLSRIRDGKPPDHILDEYKISAGQTSFRWKLFAKLIIGTIVKGTGLKMADVAWKKNRKHYSSSKSRMNHLNHFFFQERLRLNNKKLIKYYNPLCVMPDLNKKYIYFAAAYQPEARTNTNCGIFKDQFLALDILSAIIPEDWVIYYKECPYTFDDSYLSRGSLNRDKYYFEKINTYKNVQIIPFNVNTFKLIDSAQAVSTVAGTVGLESIIRGIPALVFGRAWYVACKSLFRIKNLEDAKLAMEKILSGYKPDQVDIKRYIAAIEATAGKDIMHRHFGKRIQNCDNPEKEIKKIGDLLIRFHKQFYG